MDEFRELLRTRLAGRGDLARLSETSGIASHVLGRWRDGIGRPTDINLRRLAPALGVPYEELARMCGYLPGEPDIQTDRHPQLTSLLAHIEAGWPAMDESARELAARGARALFAVQPAPRGEANGHRDDVAKRRPGGRRALDKRSHIEDESPDQGGLRGVFALVSFALANCSNSLRRPLWQANPLRTAQVAH